MNTIRSTGYGWVVLCIAGGGAYYFAKQSINADRASRYQEEQKRKAQMTRLEIASWEKGESTTPKGKKKTKSQTDPSEGSHHMKCLDHAGSPSSEISEDAAPVGHAPVDNEQRMREKSKYEAAEPYRSKKGNRFS